MLAARTKASRRRGSAVIETAAVMIVFILILFGVVEYCRYIFLRQLVDNAAREGGRYAVVHSYDDTVEADTKAQILTKMNGMDKVVKNFTIQIYHADSSGARVTGYDATATNNYATFSDATGTYVKDKTGVAMYTAKDATGTYLLDGTTKVYVTIDSNSNTVTGKDATFAALVSKKGIQNVDPMGNAKFGEYIGVEISCEYDPITPSLLRLGSTMKIRAKALMYSEAN